METTKSLYHSIHGCASGETHVSQKLSFVISYDVPEASDHNISNSKSAVVMGLVSHLTKVSFRHRMVVCPIGAL
jgi:hypothetical protein